MLDKVRMADDLALDEDMAEAFKLADDLVMAEHLQLAEVLRLSVHPDRYCVVCSQVLLPEASWKPDNCDHIICIGCLCQCAPETETTELLKCPMACCESLLKPETHRVINVDDERVISVEDESLIVINEMDNGKGKKPCNDVLQDPGQCSSGATTSNEFYCTICMETVPAIERFSISGCTHAFCVGCVRQYIAAKVEENTVSICCPDPGCKGGKLHPETCRDVIPLELFQRWGAALCDMALGVLKFYCPFKDCSALLVDDPRDGEAAITEAECPHCSRMFCAQCKVPWHDGVACAEFQRLGMDERGKEDLLLRKVAQESKWQRCPKCKMYVERVEGCVFIVCRCGHCFCYLCASTMSRDNHHCKSCKRTW